MLRYWLLAIVPIFLVIYIASYEIFTFSPKIKPIILPWMQLTADSEFNYYQQGINSSSISKFKQLVIQEEVPQMGFFNIKDGKFSYHCTKDTGQRCQVIADKVKELSSNPGLPDVSFFVGTGDAWDYLDQIELDFQPPPILVFAADNKSRYRKFYVLFVDDHTMSHSYIGYRRGWDQMYSEVMAGNSKYPWPSKKVKAVWRGLPTDTQNYRGLSPRSKLVAYSGLNQSILDAKFTETVIFNDSLGGFLRPFMQQFGIPPFMTVSDQIAYQIVVSADGNSTTYPGFLWRLLSSSVVIKQNSSKVQWFYHLFNPWQHYIPCDHDFDDIKRQINWVIEHPQESQAIAELATSMVEQNLTPAHIDGYIIAAINKHAELQRKAETVLGPEVR